MEKRRKQTIVIKCLFLAVVLGFVMMFVVGMCRSDARFCSLNQTRIRTDSVDSYTVVDDQGRSAIYREQDEKYKTITKILSSAEVRHDKENIYQYDNTSARIVLTGKHHSVTFIIHDIQPDGSVLLILKDYCKDKSTVYMLDHHDYLITYLSEKDYSSIFN